MAMQRIPELYADNLDTLKNVLVALEELTKIDGVFAAEIRVRVDDVESWAVIGWGDAGEPCILRFEDDFEPILTPATTGKDWLPNPNIYTITYGNHD